MKAAAGIDTDRRTDLTSGLVSIYHVPVIRPFPFCISQLQHHQGRHVTVWSRLHCLLLQKRCTHRLLRYPHRPHQSTFTHPTRQRVRPPSPWTRLPRLRPRTPTTAASRAQARSIALTSILTTRTLTRPALRDEAVDVVAGGGVVGVGAGSSVPMACGYRGSAADRAAGVEVAGRAMVTVLGGVRGRTRGTAARSAKSRSA